MEKINVHIVVPQKMYDKLKREGLLNKDNIAEIGHVWICPTQMKDLRVCIGLPDRTPYTHVASISNTHLDLKTAPM